MADELARLSTFLTERAAEVNIAVDPSGDFMVAAKWGFMTGDDKPTAGAAYGVGATIDRALDMALKDAPA